MAIFVTGDIHSEIYPRFNTKNFPVQKELTKDDYVIICGDFGIPWFGDRTDAYALKELEKRPFTTLFVDGNHENYDKLNTHPVETWNGGNIHKLNDSVFHLMRGQVFTINGKTIFTFGGAPSHDIQDGILENDQFVKENVKHMQRLGKTNYRINHVSWWVEEMPNESEYQTAMTNLEKVNFNVDFIFSHEAPSSVKTQMGYSDTNPCSDFLQNVKQRTGFKRWYFGHYHDNRPFYWDRSIMIYDKIEQIA